MVHASYTCKGNTYTVEIISNEDMIDTDIQSVVHLIEGTDIDKYRTKMVESVEQGLAFAVFKNGERVGFMYNKETHKGYYGCSINIPDNVALMIAMKTVFELSGKHKIQFTPHGKASLKAFISMAKGHNIRAYHSGSPYITIVKSYIEPKTKKLFPYLGIEEII